jgi:hypothetical protein
MRTTLKPADAFRLPNLPITGLVVTYNFSLLLLVVFLPLASLSLTPSARIFRESEKK